MAGHFQHSRPCIGTMGNILTTSMGLAQFYADLYHDRKLLSEASIKEMTTFQKLTIGTEPPAGTL